MRLVIVYWLFERQGLAIDIILIPLSGFRWIFSGRQVLLRTVEALLVTNVKLNGILWRGLARG